MKTTVSVIKADIGSVSGHCVAHPDLMEICPFIQRLQNKEKFIF